MIKGLLTNMQNRRGTLSDYVSIIAITLASAIGVLIIFKLTNDLQVSFSGAGYNTSGLVSVQSTYPIFDQGLLFIVLALQGIVIVAASQIDTNPIFLVYSFLVYALVLVASAIVSNIWAGITSDVAFASVTANSQPITNWLMSNLPYILMGGMIITMIVIYGKIRGGG